MSEERCASLELVRRGPGRPSITSKPKARWSSVTQGGWGSGDRVSLSNPQPTATFRSCQATRMVTISVLSRLHLEKPLDHSLGDGPMKDKIFAPITVAFLVFASDARAENTTVTFTGTIISGYDTYGLFGQPNTSLVGDSYSLSFDFNTLIGYESTPTYTAALGGYAFGDPSPNLGTNITINSVSSRFIGNLRGEVFSGLTGGDKTYNTYFATSYASLPSSPTETNTFASASVLSTNLPNMNINQSFTVNLGSNDSYSTYFELNGELFDASVSKLSVSPFAPPDFQLFEIYGSSGCPGLPSGSSGCFDLVNNTNDVVTGFDVGNPTAAADSTTQPGWSANITMMDYGSGSLPSFAYSDEGASPLGYGSYQNFFFTAGTSGSPFEIFAIGPNGPVSCIGTTGGGCDPLTVPEPRPLLLLGIGLVAVGLMRLRKYSVVHVPPRAFQV
jgi:hypothetical protein